MVNHIINIQNYANATIYKSLVARWNNNAGTYASLGVSGSVWRNTTAINSITALPDGGVFKTGSTFTLYGIAAA